MTQHAETNERETVRPQTPEVVEQRLRDAINAGDTTIIDECMILLDRLDEAKPKPNLLASALWYASVGLHVFRLSPMSKIPFKGSKGFEDATTDEQQIRAWWGATPDANIGIATGHLVDIIDIDGPPGVISWAKLKNTLPPILGKVDTPRPGGTHLYIAASGRGNKAKIADGIDYRGLGGYVVAAPSTLTQSFDPDGSIKNHAGTYSWTTPLDVEAMKAAA